MLAITSFVSLWLSLLAFCAHAAPVQPQPRSSNGPVIGSNFMDPAVIQVDGVWYAFSGANGNPAGIHIQVASSADFSSWYIFSGYDALPNPGAWVASAAHVWAPDIVQLDDGTFVLYYAAASASSPGRHCVGAAAASSIKGPFIPLSSPFACPLDQGGAIDPDGFRDPVTNSQYVVYKVDGNSIGHGGACSNDVAPIVPTPLLLQQVSASDGVTPIGNPIELISNNDAIDNGPNIEAPTLLYSAASKTYFLLYSSGCYVDTSYAVHVASAPAITGPWTKSTQPFLTTGATAADVYIPGGVDASADGSKIVFHGDLNLGWFQGNGLRVRGMYAADTVTYQNEAWLGTLHK